MSLRHRGAMSSDNVTVVAAPKHVSSMCASRGACEVRVHRACITHRHAILPPTHSDRSHKGGVSVVSTGPLRLRFVIIVRPRLSSCDVRLAKIMACDVDLAKFWDPLGRLQTSY